MRHAVMIMAMLASACGRQAPEANATVAAPSPSAAATPARSYLGRWTGVEGMVLDVAAGDAPGRFKLTMQYDLDHRQTADATLDGARLVFRRAGVAKALSPTDGKATGLKYLADKRDCLTVAPGEGYCRD